MLRLWKREGGSAGLHSRARNCWKKKTRDRQTDSRRVLYGESSREGEKRKVDLKRVPLAFDRNVRTGREMKRLYGGDEMLK